MIREITISARTLAQFGLTPSQEPLRNLGPIVLLAGANGSGKSRFLRCAAEAINTAGHLGDTLATSLLEAQRVAGTPTEHVMKQRVATDMASRDGAGRVLIEGPAGLSVLDCILSVVPLTYDIRQPIDDAARMSIIEHERAVDGTSSPGFVSAHRSIHAYLNAVAQNAFNAGHPEMANDAHVQEEGANSAAFSAIVNALLGTSLGRITSRSSGLARPLLYGRRFNADELSEGQKLLLAWAIILHRQRARLANAIVMIDEPENHLHPAACIRALEALQNDVLGSEGQIWLATHSVPLIAWAGFDAVHFVRDGRVEYAGNRVDEVVNGLLGGEDGRDKLRAFLSDAEDLALFKFAAESLDAASVAHSKEGDLQESIFSALVAERVERPDLPLRVLDYGAGHGRLAAALAGRPHEEGSRLPRNVEYLAYDRGEEPDAECMRHLAALGARPGFTAEHITDLRKLQSAHSQVHVIVLCNVLHEIPITDWLTTFGALARVLTEDGCVVLMEDQTPSVGELPNPGGFVILDALETQRLFLEHAGVRALPHALGGPWRERLTVVEVPRAALTAASPATLALTLGAVEERACRKIETLRTDGASSLSRFQRGRLHAMYALLWVNATMGRRAYR